MNYGDDDDVDGVDEFYKMSLTLCVCACASARVYVCVRDMLW